MDLGQREKVGEGGSVGLCGMLGDGDCQLTDMGYRERRRWIDGLFLASYIYFLIAMRPLYCRDSVIYP